MRGPKGNLKEDFKKRLTALNVTDMVTVMTANSRMASAVHIMSFVAYAGDEGTTSEAIAKSLQTNPVVVRKILKLLSGRDWSLFAKAVTAASVSGARHLA